MAPAARTIRASSSRDDRGRHVEVRQAGRVALQPLALAAVSERDDPDPLVAALVEDARRRHELVDPVRLSHRAGIERHEAAVESELLEVGGVRLGRPEEVGLGQIRDDDELVGRHTLPDEELARALAADDDALGRAVQRPLEPLGRGDLGSVREEAELDRHVRPHVLDLENERDPAGARVGEPVQADRERCRGRVDDVRLRHARRGQGRGERVAAVGEDPLPLREPLRVRDPDPDHVDAVDGLAVDEPARRRRDPARLHVAPVEPDDRDAVAPLHEVARERVGASRREPSRRSELRVEVEDVHVPRGTLPLRRAIRRKEP